MNLAKHFFPLINDETASTFIDFRQIHRKGGYSIHFLGFFWGASPCAYCGVVAILGARSGGYNVRRDRFVVPRVKP
jgi:hypothetical protein